ncbi:MAG TPA: 50S ribosomal protein L31 [Patescibacteria group bacterium]|nr:50S ribosomal protein L31 [Patescibacteria group bacterium]
MKNNIHPSYHASATITCSCGAHYTTGSTKEEMVVEVCAHCHPFYTGEKKVVDTTGRVDRFKRMAARSV